MHSDSQAHKTSRYANTGFGPAFSVMDIGIEDKVAVIEPDTAFWALVDKSSIDQALAGNLVADYQKQADEFMLEMDRLRFDLPPSAVYFNPTERCNFNCPYCYLPESMRRNGTSMTAEELLHALSRLSDFFSGTLPKGQIPELIFHGSEPMLAKDAVFEGIKAFHKNFHFGIQTNTVLLDDDTISFLTEHEVGIGISLDGPNAKIADATRKNWGGTGEFDHVVKVMDRLKDYPAFNVITTVTSANVHALPDMVDFYHRHRIKVVMLNPVRCTLEGGRNLKPDNDEFAKIFCRALDRAFELFENSGRKLVISNFANVLAGIVGPTGRRLMCDISPCGGGRCFFAVSATGDVFPCSEFIGFPEYNGGNLYQDDLDVVLKSAPFQEITARKIETIEPCKNCAIRHFCGAPCPAEVKMVSGSLNSPSPYCEFYEQQVRYAFRVIAKGREQAYLWDGWQEETEEMFKIG